MESERRKQEVLILHMTKSQINDVEIMANYDRKEGWPDHFIEGSVQEEKLRGLEIGSHGGGNKESPLRPRTARAPLFETFK